MIVPIKPLLLAFLVGLSGNASLAGLTVSQVSFSIFPFIAFGLALYQLYHLYLDMPLEGDTPLCSGAAFLLGALGYSTLVRVIYPDIGSNFIPLMLCVVLAAWLGYKLQLRSGGDDPES
jgi:hypothetical protein